MKIYIQSIHFDAGADLLKETSEKLAKLDKLSDRIETCSVMLKKEKNGADSTCFVEVRLAIPGEDLFASERAETFAQAVDRVTDDLKKQLVKRKEKTQHFDRIKAVEID